MNLADLYEDLMSTDPATERAARLEAMAELRRLRQFRRVREQQRRLRGNFAFPRRIVDREAPWM